MGTDRRQKWCEHMGLCVWGGWVGGACILSWRCGKVKCRRCRGEGEMRIPAEIKYTPPSFCTPASTLLLFSTPTPPPAIGGKVHYSTCLLIKPALQLWREWYKKYSSPTFLLHSSPPPPPHTHSWTVWNIRVLLHTWQTESTPDTHGSI